MDPRHPVRRALSWVAAATLFLSLVPIATPAEADGGDASLFHACAGPRGQLRAVEATDPCHSSENPVHWALGSYGRAVEVVDSLGQHVGFPSLLGPQVARQVGDAWLLLPVAASGFFPADLPPAGAFPVFEARDCQGTAYLQAAQGFFQGVFRDGVTIVYPRGPIQTRSVLSMRFFGTCFNFFAASPLLTGAMTPFDAGTLAGLVPPFRLQ